MDIGCLEETSDIHDRTPALFLCAPGVLGTGGVLANKGFPSVPLCIALILPTAKSTDTVPPYRGVPLRWSCPCFPGVWKW